MGKGSIQANRVKLQRLQFLWVGMAGGKAVPGVHEDGCAGGSLGKWDTDWQEKYKRSSELRWCELGEGGNLT